MMRCLMAMAAVALAGGCGLLPDAYSGCDKAQPYQAAQDLPPLRVPEGADLPDTRNALRIPAAKTPELPADAGRCLDHPPSYAGPTARSG